MGKKLCLRSLREARRERRGWYLKRTEREGRRSSPWSVINRAKPVLVVSEAKLVSARKRLDVS